MTRFLAILALSLTAPLAAQTVTVASPNTVNVDGKPKAVQDVFIRGTDGAILNPGGVARSSEETAFRAGRAYSVSTGRATVAAGNVLCIYLENTGTNTYYLTSRLFTHNLPDAVAQPYSFGISALTGANLPPSVGTATNRNGTATAPGLTIRYGVSTVANQPTGTVGPGNFTHGDLSLGESYTRTLLPGGRFANCSEGASTGLMGNADSQQAITITLYYD